MPNLFSLALVFSAFFSLPASAAPDSELVKATLEAAPACANFVRFDDQYLYLGFGIYRHAFEEPRQPIPGELTVTPLGHPELRFTLRTLDAAIDATRNGDSLFVLTYSAIEEWNLSTKARVAAYDTYAHTGPMAYREHAQAFARQGDTLVIAHGRLGVSFFNLKTRRLTNQFRLVQNQLPLESMAVGVSVTGDTAYVLLDNFSLVEEGNKQPFRGLVLLDVPGERVRSELDGLDPGSDAIVSDGQRAIVSFGGIPIWKYSLGGLTGRGLPEPDLRIWRFPRAGHPTGSPALDEKYYFSCFSAAPSTPGGHYRNIPLALNRAELGLN